MYFVRLINHLTGNSIFIRHCNIIMVNVIKVYNNLYISCLIIAEVHLIFTTMV